MNNTLSALADLFGSAPLLFAGLLGLLGLMVGSFLNVVAHRVPKILEREWRRQCADLRGEVLPDEPRYNLLVPRSACPQCGQAISPLHNIPVISYFALRGRCSQCKAPIGARYPLVELATGLLTAWVGWHFGVTWTTVAALFFVWALLALTFIDIDTQLLPDNITQPLLWLGLIVNTAGLLVPLADAVIGAAAGYLSLWLVYWAFKLITGKEGMGYGDFKLLAAIGAWLGWQILPLVILASSLVGAIVGVTLIIVAKRGRHIPIPFGPYLAGGGFIALMWGHTLTDAYLRGFQ